MDEEQPKFPQIAINVTPQGMMVSVALAPGLTLTQNLGEDIMNQVCARWLETRQEIKQNLAIIEHVKRSKNN
jgi:hypothetical protein